MGIQNEIAKHRAYSDETRAKMSLAQIGRRHSAETRAKMSAANMGNTRNLGRHLSAEHKAKISAAKRARDAAISCR